MAGITRAADRVALWHLADINPETGKEAVPYKTPEEVLKQHGAPTSTPPAGAVTIPNTNKFKTPVNNLKNFLSALSQSKELDPKVQLADWLDNHKAFHPYLKPQYAPAIQATLGKDLYQHFVKNLPDEHLHALTTHQQLPAPKSNKFIGPANQLKKMLNQGTSNNKLWAWMDTHPQFVKTYLHNPAYQDAIKGHVGEGQYNYWAKDLKIPGHEEKNPIFAPKPTPLAEGTPADQMLHDQVHGPKPKAEKPFAGTTLTPKDVAPPPDDEITKIKEHQQEQASPEDQAFKTWFGQTKGMDEEQAKHEWAKMSPQGVANWSPGGLYYNQYHGTGGWEGFGEEHPKPTGPHHNQYTDPSQLEKNKPKPVAPPEAQLPSEDADEAQKIKDLQGEQQGGLGDELATASKLDPWADFSASAWNKLHKQNPEQAKQSLAGWLEYAKDSPGKQKVQEIYDKWFGEQPHPDAQPGVGSDDAYNNLVDNSNENDEGKFNDTFAKPGFKSWWLTLDDEHKHYYENNAQEAVIDWTLKHGDEPEPGDQDEINQVKLHQQEQDGGGQQEIDPDHLKSVLQDKIFGTDNDDVIDGSWMQKSPGKVKKDLQALAGGTTTDGQPLGDPKLQAKWQKVYDTLYGPQQDSDEIDQIQGLMAPGGQDEAAQQQALAKSLQEIFPHSPLDFTQMPIPELKAKMEAFQKHLVGTPGLGKQVQQLNQLYGQYFGGQNTDALAQALHKLNPNFVLDKLKAQKPEDLLAIAQSQAKSHAGTPDGEAYQQLVKQFGDQPQNFGGEAAPKTPSATPAPYDPSSMLADLKKIWPSAANFGNVESTDPATSEKALKALINGWKSSPEGPKAQAVYDKYFGAGQPAASGGAALPEWPEHTVSSQLPAGYTNYKTKKPGEPMALLPGATAYLAEHGVTPDQLSGAYKAFDGWKALSDADKQKYIQMEQGSQPAASAPYDGVALAKDFYSLYKPNHPDPLKTLWAKTLQGSPEEAKAFLNKLLDPTQDYSEAAQSTAQAMLDKYFSGKQPAQSGLDKTKTPPPAPEYNPALAWADWKKLFPSSHNVGKFTTPEEAKEWAEVTMAIKAKSVSPAGKAKAKAIQEFIDKHFGGGAPTGGTQPDPDLEAIKAEQAKLGPPEPIKPFKSQPADEADVSKWSLNKPETSYGWKNFATWWGNTKLSPEQEQGLYKSWFGKDIAPEKANQWFSAIFQQQAVPSEGDLGIQGTPAWAHASWAFGDKADKEFPLFQQWAAGEPGLPKNLSVKQKLQIWQGLDPKEKAEIQEDYAPANSVDKPAVLQALQKAYPDSDWSSWKTMSQGSLKKNLESLANAGYKPIIPIFNKAFGANIPMPTEEDGTKPAVKPPAPPPQMPANQIPNWATHKWYSSAPQLYPYFMQWAKSIGKADEVNNATGYYGPQQLTNTWSSLPEHLKYQITTMGKPPWHDLESFQAWKDAQPQLKDTIKAIKPEMDMTGLWNYNSPSYHKGPLEDLIQKETDPAKKKALLDAYHQFYGAGKMTLGETLNSIGKPPPSLKAKSWDAWLQTHTPDDATKVLKKLIKTEKNPDKWVGYVDALYKYFSTPSGVAKVTNYLGKGYYNQSLDSGILKALHQWKKQGDPDAYIYGGTGPDYNAGPYVAAKQANPWDKGKFPKFLAWTPPGGQGSYTMDPALFGTQSQRSYTAPPDETKSPHYKELLDNAKKWDPTPWNSSNFNSEFGHLMGADSKKFPGVYSGNATKAKTEVARVLRDYPDLTQWQREGLEDLWDKYFTSSGLSDKDKKTLQSGPFQSWFDAAPSTYREVMKQHPGLAIDDYEGFQRGGDLYPEVPQGSGKKVHYDLTPYHFLPFTKDPHAPGGGPKKVYFSPNSPPISYDPKKSYESEITDTEPMWPGFTKNPMRGDPGRKKDPLTVFHETPPASYGQQELVLPPGETMEPQHQPIHLHRGMGIALKKYDNSPPKPPSSLLKNHDPQQYAHQMHVYQQELHRKFLLDMIRYRLGGSQGVSKDAIPDLFNTADDTDNSKKVPVPDNWKYGPPSGASGMFDFHKWAQDNNVPPEQIWALAKKWGVDDPDKYGTPPFSQGPWTKGMDPKKLIQSDPGFAKLLLDYLEATDYGTGAGYAPPGSLGDHWSVGLDAPKGFSSGDVSVIATGDWAGQGENPQGAHAVVSWGGPGGEREINLSPGAPVRVHRVQFKAPQFGINDWVELPVEPHIRHARTQPRTGVSSSNLRYEHSRGAKTGRHRLMAYDGSVRVGWLDWTPGGEVENVDVHPDYQRHGIASEMWRRAKQIDPGIQHSSAQTPDGKAWASHVARQRSGILTHTEMRR